MGRLHGAKLAAAERGELRHPLPVGLIYDADGGVVKEPDEQIQGAVADLFAEFGRGGSALAVMRAFDAAGRLFPQRTWGGSSERRRVQPDGTVRSSRRKRAREDWTVTIRDHHEGYISWQEYLDIEVKLAANNTQGGARPAREGTALCQGIISCGVCGGRVGTRYDRGDARATYTCQVKDAIRTPQCRTVVSTTVDAAVSALFLDTITEQQIIIALAASDEVTDRRVRNHRAAELAVQRARYEADRAERAFTNVDPANRLVARSLESRWEAELGQRADAEAALATAQATTAPAPEQNALR